MKKIYKIFSITILSLLLAVAGVLTIPEKEVEASSNYLIDSNGTEYANLSAAISASTSTRTIRLTENYTLTESVTIPSYVTLLVPYKADNTFMENGSSEDKTAPSSWANGVAPFKTLTINSGVTLTVDGALVVGGVQHSKSQTQQGKTSGDYGKIVNNGSIVINKECKIYGHVTGSGSVTVSSGATLYEPLLIYDFSGGSDTASLYNRGVSPFEQMGAVNIQQKVIVNAGSTVIGMTSLYANSTINTQNITLIAQNSGILQLKNGRIETTFDGSKQITKLGTYTGSNAQINPKDANKRTLSIYGDVTAGSFSIRQSIKTFSSKNKFLAVSYLYDIVQKSGTFTLPEDYYYKIMPGSSVTIDKGAALTISSGSKLHVINTMYDPGLHNKMYPSAAILAGGGYDTLGRLFVNGTLNVNGELGGYVESSELGGKIVTSSSATLTGITTTDGSARQTFSNIVDFTLNAQFVSKGGIVDIQAGKTYESVSLMETARPATQAFKYYSISTSSDYDTSFKISDNVLGIGGTKFYFKYQTKNIAVDGVITGAWATPHTHSYSYGYDRTQNKIIKSCSGSSDCPTIVKEALATPTVASSFEFTGSKIVPTVTNYNSTYCSIINEGGTAVGDYTITISIKDSEKAAWIDSMEDPIDVVLNYSIVKAKISKEGFTDNTVYEYEYNGGVKTFLTSNYVSVVYKNEVGTTLLAAPKDAGSYTATYSIINKTNFEWEDGGSEDFTISYKINPKAITITINAKSSEYLQDLQTLTHGGYSVVGSDKLNITLSTTANKNVVGVYDITGSYNNPNYAVTFTGGTNAYEVTKATSVITASPVTVIYDGQYHSVSGTLNNSEQTITYSANNGQKDYCEGGYLITLTAAETTNYKSATKQVLLTINPRRVDIKIFPKQVTFGENASLSCEVTSGLAAGESQSILGIILTREQGEEVGSYLISGRITNGNYTAVFTEDVYYSIVPATLSGISFTGEDVVTYDGLSHTLTLVGVPQNATVEYTPANKDFVNAGDHTIAAVVKMDNYEDFTISTVLTIKKVDITITIKSLQANYGEPIVNSSEYDFTITSGTLVDGDSKDDLAITYDYISAGSQLLTSGKYTITGRSNSTNYNVTIIDGEYVVNKISSVITAENVNVVYDGALHSITATVNNNEQQIKYTANEFAAVRDNPYEVVISVEESANYLEASITRTITITKREVTIKLWDLTSSFNSALKTEGEYGFDIVSQTKLADGDDINDLAVSIKYIKEEETLNAGSYVITATSASTNYDVTIIDGTYTIGKLTDEIIIVQDTFVYDGTNHSVIAALSQSNTEQTLVYSLSNSQVNYAEEGYEVVISAAETANYSAISKTVTLFINKREVTVVVDNVYVEYGEQEKELTYEVNESELASTDDESELGITLTRYEGVTPNKYSITGSSSNINYNVTFVGNDNIVNSAYYEITKATPKITVITSSYVYDGQEHSVIATVNNTSQVVKFENNEPEVNVTEKDVTIFVEENDLYVAASTTAKLTITKKEYEYEFTTQYNTYDGRGHDPLFPVDFAENMNYEYEILFGNESVERATVAGEYTVNVTLIDNNHTGSYTFKYIMNKALPVIDVNRRDIVVNATSISADVEGYTYSIDNVNFVNELQFGALTPLTEYRVYVKCEESENYKSASKTIIVKTTRAASDITEKVALLGDELTSNNFAQLNEIAALLTEVSDADKLTIQSDIEFFERRVSEYNSKVSHLNTTAINAKNVSSKLIDFVITVSSSSLLMGAAALIVRKRFLGI